LSGPADVDRSEEEDEPAVEAKKTKKKTKTA